jgi:hypothetical protein
LDSAFSLPSISQILPDPITHNLFQPRCTSIIYNTNYESIIANSEESGI